MNAVWQAMLAMFVGSAAIAQTQSAGIRACADDFWRRAEIVATGHSPGIELEARQIGRDRCDCTFVIGKPKTCETSVVSEVEALPTEPRK